jgi:hypothetical protein
MFSLRNERRGSIVDQDIDRRDAPDLLHHDVDRRAVADIASGHRDLSAKLVAHLCSGRLQQFEPATADDQFGAEFDEATSHRGSESGAAASYQDPLSSQQVFFKHRLNPPSPPPSSARAIRPCIRIGL